MVGLLWRRPRPGHGPVGLERGARVLRERHRRAGSNARSEPARPAQGEPVAEDGYQGEYVSDLAVNTRDPTILQTPSSRRRRAVRDGRIIEQIRRSLEAIGIVFDEWYSQASVEESGAVAATIDLLRESGIVYEQGRRDVAQVERPRRPRDRVLVKSDGDFTYLAGDLAYHRDKFIVRGFDRVIDVFGADHHGQVASLKAGVRAMGVDPDRLEVKLGQMVSIEEGGETAKMSKRSRELRHSRLARL